MDERWMREEWERDERGAWHVSHLLLDSQASTHGWWKRCMQASLLTEAPWQNSDKQMTHWVASLSSSVGAGGVKPLYDSLKETLSICSRESPSLLGVLSALSRLDRCTDWGQMYRQLSPHHSHRPRLAAPPPPLRTGAPGRARGRTLLSPLLPPLSPGPLEAGRSLPTHLAQTQVQPLTVTVRGQEVRGRPRHGHLGLR